MVTSSRLRTFKTASTSQSENLSRDLLPRLSSTCDVSLITADITCHKTYIQQTLRVEDVSENRKQAGLFITEKNISICLGECPELLPR